MFFMLNSAEHEISPANKSQIANNSFMLNMAEYENFSAIWHFHIYSREKSFIISGLGHTRWIHRLIQSFTIHK